MGNVRSDDELENALAAAYDSKDEHGSKWPGASYEDGVTATIEWIKGDRDEAPMEEN